MRKCRLCRQKKPHEGRGMCRACYRLMYRQGRLEEFPPIPPGNPREHGTRRGYDQHRRAGEAACDDCLEGMRTYERKRRKKPTVTKYQRRYQRRWKEMKRLGLSGTLRCNICDLRLSMHSLSDNCARAS